MGVEVAQDITVGDGVEVFEMEGKITIGGGGWGDVEVEEG